MIPPLIPTSLSKPSKPEHDEREDLFATLFTPSTPRASPTLNPVPDNASQPAQPPRHSRTGSTDSEFGAFVSVPSTEDPLSPPVGEEATKVQFSPLQNTGFFDRFTEDAKVATERNKKGVLDELLEHEDDPLYFLHASSTAAQVPSGTSTPIPPSSAAQQSLIDLSPTSEFWNTKPLPPETAESHSPRENSPEYEMHREEERQARHPSRQANKTDGPSPSIPIPPPLRTPSLPPSPARASLPEVQPAQSIFASSSFSASAFPKKWVSSLLSRPSQRRPASLDEPERHWVTDRQTPSPPASGILSHSRMQSAAFETSTNITHGSPFASEQYVPPSGAPGFSGDRTWNTSGFEFDKENVEKKSVRLIGRKEMTTAVLTTEIADMIRPHFPALARLPRSWSLLYSLDQHGISLHTLYDRCESSKTGAVVVMQDSNGALFGAWVGEGVHRSQGSYYGGGESFLWKLTSDRHLRIYKWTGKNDYVALCEANYISFGGGDGHYGLYLDETLSDGSSAPCPTFNNEALCSAGPQQGDTTTFECVGLEVWGVG